MTISGLNSLYSTVSGIFGGSNGSVNSASTANASSTSQITDSQQFSPAAMMLSLLQQLQQSNPTQFQQVTSQIATNLESAAKTAQAAGNSTLATQLNQLGSEFQNASQTGQMPSVQQLQQAAIGGHHHHHHHHAEASSSSTSNSSSSSTSSSNAANSLDPMSIIFSTLQSSGLLTGSATSATTFSL